MTVIPRRVICRIVTAFRGESRDDERHSCIKIKKQVLRMI